MSTPNEDNTVRHEVMERGRSDFDSGYADVVNALNVAAAAPIQRRRPPIVLTSSYFLDRGPAATSSDLGNANELSRINHLNYWLKHRPFPQARKERCGCCKVRIRPSGSP